MTLVFRDLDADDGLAAADDVGDKVEDNEWCSDACCTYVGLDAIFAQMLHMGWVGDNLMQNVAANQLSTAMHCFCTVILLRCICTAMYFHCVVFALWCTCTVLYLHCVVFALCCICKALLLHYSFPCIQLHRIAICCTALSSTASHFPLQLQDAKQNKKVANCIFI